MSVSMCQETQLRSPWKAKHFDNFVCELSLIWMGSQNVSNCHCFAWCRSSSEYSLKVVGAILFQAKTESCSSWSALFGCYWIRMCYCEKEEFVSKFTSDSGIWLGHYMCHCYLGISQFCTLCPYSWPKNSSRHFGSRRLETGKPGWRFGNCECVFSWRLHRWQAHV